jgi:hypothetical protein
MTTSPGLDFDGDQRCEHGSPRSECSEIDPCELGQQALDAEGDAIEESLGLRRSRPEPRAKRVEIIISFDAARTELAEDVLNALTVGSDASDEAATVLRDALAHPDVVVDGSSVDPDDWTFTFTQARVWRD